MKGMEVTRYILAHHEEETVSEMANACLVSKGTVSNICSRNHIVAITEKDKKIAIIKEYKGTKTAFEMAELIGCSPNCVWDICKKK
jgi:hypothetical protein